MSPLAFETGDPRWMTYQQASGKGWQIRKGEKATGIMSENARYAREARADTHDMIVALRARGGTAGKLSELDIASIRVARGMFRTHHRLALAGR